MKRLLVAIDFAPVSEAALGTAIGLAKAFGGSLRLIHVAAPDPDFVGYEAGPQSVRDSRAHQLHEERVRLQAMAQSVTTGGTPADALLVQGQTALEIVRHAVEWQADAIVMGRCGHSLLRQAMLGSVSHGVLKRAPCPVVVVPAAHNEKGG